MSIFTGEIVGRFYETPIKWRLTQTPWSDALQRFHRFWLLNLCSTSLAGTARIVLPKIEHRSAEMLNDVRAIKMNVLYQRPAVFAVENDVFFLSGRTTSLDHDTDRVRRPLRRMRHIRRDKEGFAFFDDVIHEPVAFVSAHLNIPLQLIEVLLRID